MSVEPDPERTAVVHPDDHTWGGPGGMSERSETAGLLHPPTACHPNCRNNRLPNIGKTGGRRRASYGESGAVVDSARAR